MTEKTQKRIREKKAARVSVPADSVVRAAVAMESAGLTLRNYLALAIIAGSRECARTSLAAALGVSCQTAGYICTTLREKGFVEEHESDDARLAVSRVTTKGRAVLKTIKAE